MKIHHQNIFETWPIEDKSVQAIVTSPPYFGLRKYDIPDIEIGEWKGQYGLESTVESFIEHTLLWCEEVWRVLKDDGLFFLNIGDSYGGSWGNFGARKGHQRQRTSEHFNRMGATPEDFKPPMINAPSKSKLLIPHRIAIALCNKGWILRNDIIWQKPNAMPESATDRFSKKFEYIFMFSKQKKYYFDLKAVSELWQEDSIARKFRGASGDSKYSGKKSGQSACSMEQKRENKTNEFKNLSLEEKEKYKNPGDIWNIATQPSTHSHYAMWPEKLVERMIRCSTRPGDAVLDPFCGSGTTLMVAEQLNRKGIGIDLGYKEIQDDRLKAIQPSLLEVSK